MGITPHHLRFTHKKTEADPSCGFPRRTFDVSRYE